MRGIITTVALAAGLLGSNVHGIQVNVDDDASIKRAAGTAAFGLMKYYTGNNTGDVPGNLPDPYYWWTAGAMFGTIIDYWFLTGDSSYNDATMQAIIHQGSDTGDFMPKNQTRTEGNDDQGFWAMTAMSAAENKFPDPPSDKPQYLALVQAVFNQYAQRWDVDDCGGGLRWQIFSFNNGYDYKNSISNGCFFNIAARLARYTGNSTYSEWANKIFDWEQKVGLIDNNLEVLDGVTITPDKQCRRIDQLQWSYNNGIHLHGAAMMYNLTGSDLWKTRVDGMLKVTTNKFLKDGILFEQFCEPNRCNRDQQGFKGFLARWLASTSKVAPHTAGTINPILRSTAQAAAASCTGSPASGFLGQPGTACGFDWTRKSFDGLVGVPPQMNAVSALIYPLAAKGGSPFTEKTGGTSKGNPEAGSGKERDPTALSPITTMDRVGAGFITVLFIVGCLGGTSFLVT
ncbi:hypothetical protein CDD81_7757 [Ophiocordyceps australis]|uniref:Mannan endo-1,6-alpha-mannosidase n=1 Tax=Ophiocordyceps australis TaxID=1399860 RepID=A0A2C5Y2M3_9HYPO|nr:hypothetical protein CDD81_7757 [Ophiocordyceps australis]